MATCQVDFTTPRLLASPRRLEPHGANAFLHDARQSLSHTRASRPLVNYALRCRLSPNSYTLGGALLPPNPNSWWRRVRDGHRHGCA